MRIRSSVNNYSMPLIRYMFVRSLQLLNSTYYGYINSDIIVTPNLFDTLKKCQQLVKSQRIKPQVLPALLREV